MILVDIKEVEQLLENSMKNMESMSIIEFRKSLQLKHDQITSELILLYIQASKLCKCSIEYSLERIVNGKPIITLPLIKQKLDYAGAMLDIYKTILFSEIDMKSIIFFIKNILVETLEKLLQIHGASGYMQNNVSTQLWLSCRESCYILSQSLDYEI